MERSTGPFHYLPVSASEDELSDQQRKAYASSKHCAIIKDVLVILLTIACVALSVIVYKREHTFSDESCQQSRSILDPAIDLRGVVTNTWDSEYYATTKAEQEIVDQNWDQIVPALGFVAVNSSWAAEQGLHPTQSLKTDPSKSVYMIEAYHALHCTVIVRKTLNQLARNQPLDIPFDHSIHCLDGLRQHVICNADDTLLYTKKNVSGGHGQRKACRNWGALRDWAAAHPACYRDSSAAVAYESEANTGCPTNDGLLLRDWSPL